MKAGSSRFWMVVVGMFVLPSVHPLLIPYVGVASHLLWWVHVLPIALIAFQGGRVPAVVAASLSSGLVVVGERLFGAGYGAAAPWETAWSLAMAVLATHALVAGFALYARGATRRYKLLFDNATSAILRIDPEGRVVAVNPVALELFRCDLDDLLGRAYASVPFLRELPDLEALVASSWSGAMTVGCDADESIAHVSVAAAQSDDPPGYQLILVDRTHEVVQEQELERQSRLATLGGTLAGVAHELKGPLQAITGYTELARQSDAGPEEVREALDTIQREADRMGTMVQELLGFSRTRDPSERVDVAEVARRVVRIQRLARGRGVQIRERIRWSGVAWLSAVKLEQILTNLVANAVDAVPEGGGVIDVAVDRQDGRVVIEVADNGPGVDPAVIDRVFEPFVTTKPEGQGTGLGLAISRRLAADMGGELTVANRPDAGAAFRLRLPIDTREAAGPDRST